METSKLLSGYTLYHIKSSSNLHLQLLTHPLSWALSPYQNQWNCLYFLLVRIGHVRIQGKVLRNLRGERRWQLKRSSGRLLKIDSMMVVMPFKFFLQKNFHWWVCLCDKIWPKQEIILAYISSSYQLTIILSIITSENYCSKHCFQWFCSVKELC